MGKRCEEKDFQIESKPASMIITAGSKGKKLRLFAFACKIALGNIGFTLSDVLFLKGLKKESTIYRIMDRIC